MRFASEVIELMGAYPGRDWRIGQIVRYVENGRKLTPKQRSVLRDGVYRVLLALEDAQQVHVNRRKVNGAYATYRWAILTKAQHEGD